MNKLSETQIKALNKFQSELAKFLSSNMRNIYVTSGRSISVYTRKGIHLINGKRRNTLDIANISISRRGKGLGMAVVNLMHQVNPFEATYVESILNERFGKRLLKEGWLVVKEANPLTVYKDKE